MEPNELQQHDDQTLEMAVQDAIFGNGTVPVRVKLNVGEEEREFTLNMRWPDMNDEQEIDRLTVIYSNGFPSEAVSNPAYEVARARALIEVLAEAPFGAWLPPTETRVNYRGKQQLRPDTAQVKSRAVLVAVLREWSRIYIRYQTLVLE